ncbi:S-methyl-5'-thioadenosine phosphorylase [Gordonia soli]|uniref:S-methyl-5'-thioadenosine phosphorylase n=1 Tax=Gordonia soli NBRC 108243 TaxID=1223545 RepID=M0QE24_9ACTN|nr:S-methyl-5'-thioadenosine phosphorylase [Gordonia soli]GAC66576.1 methylthioadenosine phosphorylase [Gordonia soli NBRC 108243]
MTTTDTALDGDRAPEHGPAIGIIGGTGLYSFFDDAAATTELDVDTPFGRPSAPLTSGVIAGRRVVFVPRHGRGHEYLPHEVPYRANMWALRASGARRVLGACAVGSLTPRLPAGTIVVPDQLVDRTHGRPQTFFDRSGFPSPDGPVHVSFADPYCPDLRAVLASDGIVDGGTMVVIEGPRFSTRAESRWYAGQGWSLVNMTGHPEAVLARELRLCYATTCLVTDLDAGVDAGGGVTAEEVFAEFRRGLPIFADRLRDAVANLDPGGDCDCAAADHDPDRIVAAGGAVPR